jgi:2-oxoglutarate dehydrogenase E2 component (dihydrolipoamide succinyltransferase)
MKQEIKVPAVGESISQAQIAGWLRKEGEFVRKGEALVELESEKASMTVPSPFDGRLEILLGAGAEAAIGQVIAYVDEEAAPETSVPVAAPAVAPRPAAPSAPIVAPAPASTVAPASAAPAAPGEPKASRGATAAAEGVTRSPLSMMRKTIARRLVQAKQEAAHLTTFNEVDMEEIIRIRKAFGEDFQAKYRAKLGFMSFFVKAAVKALQEFPIVNSRIEGDELVTADFYDIGVAVSTDRGLLVPVLRDADRMSFGDIEAKLADLATRAREKRIELSELQGGTFTITNGGVFGSMLSTPIPNYPQSAILGMHAIQRRPVAVGDAVVVRSMMYLALTYDHRLIDGRDAVLFLIKIKESIEDPERLILGL